MPEECECKDKDFCPECQVKLYLKKKGPCVVYSGDLKTTDESVKPVYDRIPIVELFEGQELEFEAIAQLGYGKEHIKWQGGIMNFRNIAKIKLNDKSKIDVLIDICPKKIFEKSDGKVVIKEEKCDLCNICKERFPDIVDISIHEDSFIIELERASGIPVEELINEAIDIISRKIDEMLKAI